MPPAAWASAAVFAISLATPSRAADPQPYDVTFAKTGDASIDKLAKETSNLVTLRTKAPAGPFALVLRARSDEDRLRTVLNSAGYYDGQVTITIDGKSLDDPNLPQTIANYASATPIPIEVTMTRGPLFHLGQVAVKGDVPATDMAAFQLKSGAPARAEDVIAAGARLQSALLNDGYAFAKVSTPSAFENPAQHTIDVTYTVATGPRVDIGPISVQGLRSVHQGFVQREMSLKPGEQYSPDKIESERQTLAGLHVFSSVQAQTAKQVGPDGRLPVTFIVTEGPPRTVSFTAGYASDTGGTLGASWTHYNLFGGGEQLNLSATATGLGGSSTDGLGYNIGATYTLPAFLRRDQSLSFNVGALKQNFDAYNQTALLAGTTLTRKLDKHWSASVGLSGIIEQVEQENITRDYDLLQVPLTLKYDSTNSLFDPTKGIRATASITPTESFLEPSAFFTIMQLSGSTYLDLTGKGRSIIALRGLVGSVQGASTFQLPPDQRFYAGGSNTIRGYAYQSVGPQFADGNPIGGTAIDTGTVEYRQRIGKSFGTAVFVDAGQVSSSSAPFKGSLKVGAGLGVRYYTPIGPIRVDFAVPLVHQDNSGTFQFYIGIGQAF
ncbi:MAG TPA: autotransporter assembly complex family protein [Acidisoma sp.]|uniref:autotransporter assembly complex protein TamA n=1 Tax=Acidisoma sp. TaxID=1872115 RepID=UPI002C2B39B0|nr:autotransporter assembly complex family protein [Acidisoma sp.]HTI01714.1 autotransporter assembly complex family protein [Acidisoma sp.]